MSPRKFLILASLALFLVIGAVVAAILVVPKVIDERKEERFTKNEVTKVMTPVGDFSVFVMDLDQVNLFQSYQVRSMIEDMNFIVTNSGWLEEFFGKEENFDLAWRTPAKVSEPKLGDVKYLFLAKVTQDKREMSRKNSRGDTLKRVSLAFEYRVIDIALGSVVQSNLVTKKGMGFSWHGAQKEASKELDAVLQASIADLKSLPKLEIIYE